ncbi:glutathione S-transferase-like [Onthophagus taurus]|uniref:glutathione S-transferase-like n=1 Tax=Onthophagus taurus TaxID=166361 RepID=UPI000C206520|nr:glutathione S-transferase-like [Onthophagus taurus]
MSQKVTPKITYFNFRGLAELPRLICKYGKINFEDIRLNQEDWATIKPTTPFGVLPLYEEDGKICNQSIAISRYLAKRVGLYGDDDWENLEIDSVVDTITDLRLKLTQVFREEDETKKAADQEVLINETFPYYLERLDKIAAQNFGHMAAKKLTWADFHFAICYGMFAFIAGEDTLIKYKNLVKVKDNVESIATIKNWMRERPVTDF